MIEWTALQVMILRVLLALVYFEGEQIEEHDALAHAYLACIKASAMGGALVRVLLPLLGRSRIPSSYAVTLRLL